MQWPVRCPAACAPAWVDLAVAIIAGIGLYFTVPPLVRHYRGPANGVLNAAQPVSAPR
jgi:hypothetical protein